MCHHQRLAAGIIDEQDRCAAGRRVAGPVADSTQVAARALAQGGLRRDAGGGHDSRTDAGSDEVPERHEGRGEQAAEQV